VGSPDPKSVQAAGVSALNGYGNLSPGGYGHGVALLIEVVLTAVFLLVILAATAKKAAPAMAGLAIGLALTLIHLTLTPVTNTSVNPARSTSRALFAGSDQIGQLLLFWVAPIVGAALGAALQRYALRDNEDVVSATIRWLSDRMTAAQLAVIIWQSAGLAA
jgi:aquaporin Z